MKYENRIILAGKELCTGCGACASVCPKGCIQLVEDEEGFLQPKIDKEACIRCHQCENICPVLNPLPASTDFETNAYAARLKDADELSEVSSGGAFWALAQAVLAESGVVYGAAQCNMDEVQHVRVDNVEDAKKLRRSKYLPSNTDGIFAAVKADLEKGLPVLFSGTGCQIAGLLAFLQSDYENLITCDVVCHGIPSMKVWKAYKKEKEIREGKKIVDVVFRDKSKGWSNNQYKITYEDGSVEKENSTIQLFHHGYLKGLFYRQSCGNCLFARLPRQSDITLADYWQYKGELCKDDKGVSLVCVNSQKGQQWLTNASKYLVMEPTKMQAAIDSCRHLTHSPLVSPNRARFFKELERKGYYSAAKKYIAENDDAHKMLKKLKRRLKKVLHCIGKKTDIKTIQSSALNEAFLLLNKKHVPVFFYHRVSKEEGFAYSPSAMKRMENDLSFPVMYENIDKYFTDLQELLGSNITKEYVKELGKIPQVIQKGKRYCHEDVAGDNVNVVEGRRVTCCQPIQHKRTLHVYGRCGAFGYAVEDKDTLPSCIQSCLNKIGVTDIRVINHGLWGGTDEHIVHNFLIDAVGMKEGDMVLFYQHKPEPSVLQQWEKHGVWFKDISHEWHQYDEASWCFYNYPGHMNAVGYKNAAEIICKDLQQHQFGCRPIKKALSSKTRNLDRYLATYVKDSGFDDAIRQFVDGVVRQYPIVEGQRCGAVVMNCNPFTLGHRYLIERAVKEVDRLYVFVVEEDRSFFKFKDRFEMVKSGTADMANVCVVPSGNYIISALTFPEYFMKDYVQEKDFDMSSDVEIFGGKIAPALRITKRFAGEEPLDAVTRKYNDTMKTILPRYGVEFVEIPRLHTSDDRIINATRVRQMLQEKNFDGIRAFVPESTMKVLKERYSRV